MGFQTCAMHLYPYLHLPNLLRFLVIGPVLLLSCVDISLFGLHYTFIWLQSDDDDDEHYDII